MLYSFYSGIDPLQCQVHAGVTCVASYRSLAQAWSRACALMAAWLQNAGLVIILRECCTAMVTCRCGLEGTVEPGMFDS
jgi:hypothetical protein